MTTFGTYKKVTKDIFITVFRLRVSVFAFFDKSLYRFKGFTVNNRLVNILENLPVFFGILKPFLVLKALGVGFEVYNITAIFLTDKNLTYGRAFPFVRVRLYLFTASAYASLLPIRGAILYSSVLQGSCNFTPTAWY